MEASHPHPGGFGDTAGADTIVALATPAGEAALAMVRASGPACARLAGELHRRKAPLPPRRAIHFGYYDDGGCWLDDVVGIFYPAGNSFTGEASLEITCHGNPLIAQSILRDLVARGCRFAEPGEFSRRAFVNGRIDLSQAEGIADLIRARSEKALEVARSQMNGALGERMARLTDRLLGVQAAIEAYIDFPEEDLPPEDPAGPLRDIDDLRRELADLIATQAYRELLQEGFRVAIIGPPNAGKSSLINCLCGEKRALVSPEPGTTRDYIRETIQLAGHKVQIMDTAGLRDQASGVEAAGIDLTREQADRAHLLLLVLDAADPPEEEALVPLRTYAKVKPCVVLENKADLPHSVTLREFLPGQPHCRLSLKTRDGFPEFLEVFGRALNALENQFPRQEVALNTRHTAALESAGTALAGAKAHLQTSEPELAALDIRTTVEAVAQVVGKIDNEAMLDKLFASFCIGK